MRRRARSRGSSLLEFSLCAYMVMIVLLGMVELSRLILVYTTVANAARAAARYAIVHGANRTGSGADGPSGPDANPPQVVDAAKRFASAGLLDESRLSVAVTYPAGTNAVGGRVSVTVTYPYDPLVGMLPFRIPLRNTSHGAIVF